MPTKPNLPPADAALRRSAEERLKEQHLERDPARTEPDTQRLVHELQVQQIELEMQKEELQQARNEMESGLEKYSDLYDFAPVSYVTLDREGNIREANLASATLLGMERSRLIQRRLGLYVSESDRPAFATFLTRVFGSQDKESCEVNLLQVGQPPIAARIEATAAASGLECRMVLEDITKQKQDEENRLILNKLESTGILAGGIAHDFNNLLTVILMNLELAEARPAPGPELALRLAEAKQAALASRDLTQQLITFARGGALVRKPIRLSGVIQESVRAALSGSRGQCHFSLPEDLWLVEVDEGQIGQVFRNMVLNAREAMPQGGLVSVRAENVVLSSQEHPSLPGGDYVRISIADQGSGITKQVLPKIFDPYFSTKQRGVQRGVGLGLTICHAVIQKHGGAIAVESSGGGTTFHILLPAFRKAPVEIKVPELKPLARTGKILVMDDELAVRKVLGWSLQRGGHQVELVEDGQSAIEAYTRAKQQGHPFDVVILDLTVRGGMGGQEAVLALLQIDPSVQAIVMSGYSDDPAMVAPARYGFRGVLPKPFELGELQKTLAQLMESQPRSLAAL